MHISKFRLIVVAQIVYMIQAKPRNVKMPAKCKNKNFCFELDNYPQKEIDAVFKKFDIDIVDDIKTEERNSNTDKKHQLQICDYATELRLITYIRDTEGKVRYVVQSETQHFMQQFEIVQCRNPGLLQNHTWFTAKDLCRYKVSCNDKLVPIHFLVLSVDKKNVEWVTIKDGLPMACSCEYISPKADSTECESFGSSDEVA